MEGGRRTSRLRPLPPSTSGSSSSPQIPSAVASFRSSLARSSKASPDKGEDRPELTGEACPTTVHKPAGAANKAFLFETPSRNRRTSTPDLDNNANDSSIFRFASRKEENDCESMREGKSQQIEPKITNGSQAWSNRIVKPSEEIYGKGHAAPDEVLQNSRRQNAALRAAWGNYDSMFDKLLVSAENGNVRAVAALLELGIAADKPRGRHSFTALHYACTRGHLQVARELLARGADPNALTKDRETGLHLAAYHGFLSIVELLLDYGADVNATNEYGETALFNAARQDQVAVIRLLIQRGIDVNIENKIGDLAIDEADRQRAKQAFQAEFLGATGVLRLKQGLLHRVFSYLDARTLSRAATICGPWHRCAESSDLWEALGVRRWELSLKAMVGFGSSPLATMNFLGKGRKKRPTTTGTAPSRMGVTRTELEGQQNEQVESTRPATARR